MALTSPDATTKVKQGGPFADYLKPNRLNPNLGTSCLGHSKACKLPLSYIRRNSLNTSTLNQPSLYCNVALFGFWFLREVLLCKGQTKQAGWIKTCHPDTSRLNPPMNLGVLGFAFGPPKPSASLPRLR